MKITHTSGTRSNTTARAHTRLTSALTVSAGLLLSLQSVKADGADQDLAVWDFNTAAGPAPSTVPNIDNVTGVPSISFTSGSPVAVTGIAGTAWTSHDFSGSAAGLNTPPRHVVVAGNAHGWNDVWVDANPSGLKKGILTLTINTTGFKDLSLRFDYRSQAATPVVNHDLTVAGNQVLGNEALVGDGTWKEYYYDLRWVPGAENNAGLVISINDFDTGITHPPVHQLLIDNVLVMGRPLADAESTSNIVGVQGITMTAQTTYMLGQNLQNYVVAEGVVTSVAGAVIGDTRAVFTNSLTAGQAYLFETTKSAQTGYHQGINAGWTGQTVTLTAAPGGAAAAGSRYAIRRIPTISSLLGPTNEANLQGGATSATADILWVWDDILTDYRKYYYDTDVPAGWRRISTGALAPNDLITPYDAVFIEKVNGTARTYWFTGDVKVTPAMIPIVAGDNFVARLLPEPYRIGSSQLHAGVDPYNGSINTQDPFDVWTSWFSDGTDYYDLYTWLDNNDGAVQSGVWISNPLSDTWPFQPRLAVVPGPVGGVPALTLPPLDSSITWPLVTTGAFAPATTAPTINWQDRDRVRYWVQRSTDLRTWNSPAAAPNGLSVGNGGAPAAFTDAAAVPANTSLYYRVDSPAVFLGGSDSSAVQIVDQSNLALVADDEATNLDLYDLKTKGASVANSGDIAAGLLLAPPPATTEADFEGLTCLAAGGQTYYLLTTSHGRNKDGELRLYDAATGSIADPLVPGQQYPNRSRLFAVTVNFTNGVPAIAIAGTVYRNFEYELGRWDRQNLHGRGVNFYGVANAIGMTNNGGGQLILNSATLPLLAPKVNGLSLEGLSVDSTGTQLLFGLRNPLRAGRAIIMRVTNPLNVLGLNGAPLQAPVFDAGTDITLGGRGIRSIEWSPALGAYLIVAGTKDGVSNFAVYRWSGNPVDNPIQILNNGIRWNTRKLRPEGLAVYPDRTDFFIVSDDGTQPLRDDLTPFNGVSKNAPEAVRRFSGAWLAP